jgi:hypothetical protein
MNGILPESIRTPHLPRTRQGEIVVDVTGRHLSKICFLWRMAVENNYHLTRYTATLEDREIEAILIAPLAGTEEFSLANFEQCWRRHLGIITNPFDLRNVIYIEAQDYPLDVQVKA